MSTSIDLKQWTNVRKEVVALTLALTTVLPLMDTVMADTGITEARRESLMVKLVDQYLPE
tara:strand:- start:3057 stop:3236 length:180 start_codon:yes stop_codon:yes gene_type:complete